MHAIETINEFSCGFVHKRIFGAARGAIGSLVTGGNPIIGATRGFVTSGGMTASKKTLGVRQTQPSLPARVPVSAASLVGKRKQLVGSACGPGFRFDPVSGICVFTGSPAGRGLPPLETVELARPIGDAVMGMHGVALEPGVRQTATLVCLPGMVLGTDDLCYNKAKFPNKQRKHPKGRKPLLTGGELNAISVATRAAGRVKTQVTRLQNLGLLDKPKSKAKQKQIAPPAPVVVVQDGHGHH